MRLSTPALVSHTRRNKRFHLLQQEKQAKVTLEAEERVGESASEQGMPSQQEPFRGKPRMNTDGHGFFLANSGFAEDFGVHLLVTDFHLGESAVQATSYQCS